VGLEPSEKIFVASQQGRTS